ncbi:hypothetical protein G3480_12410 [Thiorhodococcus mannitoliphagus]|uniref:Lipoprotein n=1 Tax=Thiorhodococcus mannitoliphagus TaxID=329406 RepID=A0A6P1DZF8_9GAMM|nr:hypothetical protein [Thiorhodococcus mannitoliphagus]NEX21104.1 hypothetical protein [Thiorhodococcus mannitoliphagus]
MRPRLLLVLSLVCLAAALAGCKTLVRESVPGDWVEVPPGSAVRFNRPIEISPGRARAFLTTGSALAEGTSCAVEVRRIDHEKPQAVAAGTYQITRVQNDLALVSKVDDPSRGAVRFQLAGHGDSGGSQMVRFGYHFWLDDGQDPNLMRMTCLGRLDDPAYTRPPTLEEIRAVLGDQATLELAGQPVEPKP